MNTEPSRGRDKYHGDKSRKERLHSNTKQCLRHLIVIAFFFYGKILFVLFFMPYFPMESYACPNSRSFFYSMRAAVFALFSFCLHDVQTIKYNLSAIQMRLKC